MKLDVYSKSYCGHFKLYVIIVKNVHIMIVSDVAKKLHTVTFVQSLE